VGEFEKKEKGKRGEDKKKGEKNSNIPTWLDPESNGCPSQLTLDRRME
jgi:hypothetical protein